MATGRWKSIGLGRFAQEHLEKRAENGDVVPRRLASVQKHLTEAVAFFGSDRDLASIGIPDVERYADYLKTVTNGRSSTISPGTQRKYLNSLGDLFRRAMQGVATSAGKTQPGNPVHGLYSKPVGGTREAAWLEVHDAALLLEAARTYRPNVKDARQGHGGAISAKPNPHVYPIIATFLLTGGRKSEVLGLEVDDVSFQRKTITFRPNGWRRLKNETSHRPVPLHPQLEEILRAYMLQQEASGNLGTLLFPSVRGKQEMMIQDLRKALDTIGERAGWKAGEIRTKMFRHTYCAARLQTLDRGHPVAPWTVARELGHGGTTMVEKIYGHMGTVRHRSEDVAYRVEEHRKDLDERLRKLEAASQA